MAYYFPPSKPQQKAVNEANLDSIASTDDVLVDHSTVTITGEEGVGGGGNLLASRVLYLDFPHLTAIAAADTDDLIAIYDTSAGVHKAVPATTAVPGALVYKYSDNDCMITASNTGVTVTKDSVNGEMVIDVPAAVNLYSVNLTGEQTDTDDDSNLFIKIVYASEGTICQDLLTIDIPHVTYVNTTYAVANSSVVSETFPAPYDSTKNIHLVKSELDGSDAVLRIKVESIVDNNFMIKLTF